MISVVSRSARVAALVALLLACTLRLFPDEPSTEFRITPSELSLAELIERASEIEGSIVSVTGEAIGPAMIRGDMAWVNIEDSGVAVGVWLPVVDVKAISFFGSYSSYGDILRVVGTFHRACGSHGGDLDIHALSVNTVRVGAVIEHPLSSVRIVVSMILGLLALSLLAVTSAVAARRRSA